MLMWELFKPKEKGKYAVETKCEYNPESGYYVITMKKGERKKFKKFKAAHPPKGECEYMHVKDLEKAVKLSNVLDKEFRQK